MTELPESFPLFKGATRTPTVAGIPMIPLLMMFIIVASIAMIFGLLWWFMILPIGFIMAQITKNDDKAFYIWWLWIDTKLRNNNSFWNASTYSKIAYKDRNKLWE